MLSNIQTSDAEDVIMSYLKFFIESCTQDINKYLSSLKLLFQVNKILQAAIIDQKNIFLLKERYLNGDLLSPISTLQNINTLAFFPHYKPAEGIEPNFVKIRLGYLLRKRFKKDFSLSLDEFIKESEQPPKRSSNVFIAQDDGSFKELEMDSFSVPEPIERLIASKFLTKDQVNELTKDQYERLNKNHIITLIQHNFLSIPHVLEMEESQFMKLGEYVFQYLFEKEFTLEEIFKLSSDQIRNLESKYTHMYVHGFSGSPPFANIKEIMDLSPKQYKFLNDENIFFYIVQNLMSFETAKSLIDEDYRRLTHSISKELILSEICTIDKIRSLSPLGFERLTSPGIARLAVEKKLNVDDIDQLSEDKYAALRDTNIAGLIINNLLTVNDPLLTSDKACYLKNDIIVTLILCGKIKLDEALGLAHEDYRRLCTSQKLLTFICNSDSTVLQSLQIMKDNIEGGKKASFLFNLPSVILQPKDGVEPATK